MNGHLLNRGTIILAGIVLVTTIGLSLEQQVSAISDKDKNEFKQLINNFEDDVLGIIERGGGDPMGEINPLLAELRIDIAEIFGLS